MKERFSAAPLEEIMSRICNGRVQVAYVGITLQVGERARSYISATRTDVSGKALSDTATVK